MKPRNFERRVATRKEEAAKRQEERNNRSNQEQLRRLDAAGFVAAKERTRLSKVND